MTVKEDFQAAAVEIFNSFESMIIDGVYVQQTSGYAAGGNLSITPTEYPVRLLRDQKNVTLTLAQDIPLSAEKYLAITADLPVAAKVKDKVRIGADWKVIVAVDSDPGDIITVMYIE